MSRATIMRLFSSGWADQISARAPDVRAVACEVPEPTKTSPLLLSVVMPAPGALRVR